MIHTCVHMYITASATTFYLLNAPFEVLGRSLSDAWTRRPICVRTASVSQTLVKHFKKEHQANRKYFVEMVVYICAYTTNPIKCESSDSQMMVVCRVSTECSTAFPCTRAETQ